MGFLRLGKAKRPRDRPLRRPWASFWLAETETLHAGNAVLIRLLEPDQRMRLKLSAPRDTLIAVQSSMSMRRGFRSRRRGRHPCIEIGRVDVVFSSSPA